VDVDVVVDVVVRRSRAFRASPKIVHDHDHDHDHETTTTTTTTTTAIARSERPLPREAIGRS
jgi:hypothetical protein